MKVAGMRWDDMGLVPQEVDHRVGQPGLLEGLLALVLQVVDGRARDGLGEVEGPLLPVLHLRGAERPQQLHTQDRGEIISG